MMHITCVVGARPNFPKIAPILRAARGAGVETALVHTGQHYDERMSDLFFEELRIPKPDAYLGVGSGSHAVQTGQVMISFDRALDEQPTDMVLVVGDVNSTIACALVAVKRGICVAHVEAGLRSYDRTMPEEINRILTDQISDLLFTSERAAADNLVKEGVDPARVHFVGNVMIDTLFHHREEARRRPILRELALSPREYALCTLHRPSNVDDFSSAANMVEALRGLSRHLPVVLPLHPRTRGRLMSFGLFDQLVSDGTISVLEPLGYLDFLALMEQARLVLTDSGGIQEETTALGVPCLTFRHNTERPVTITNGTNQLVGCDPDRVAAAAGAVLIGNDAHRRPELWDGAAAERIVGVIVSRSTPVTADGVVV